MSTIYDVAKLANVSAMTVSRVINHSPSIKPETRKRVEQAIKELDYIPNRTAQSLSSKDSKLLSLIITDITNPFFTNVARGAEEKANQLGYQLVFSNSDENIEKETSYIRSTISRGIDGVLFTPTGDESQKNIHLLAKFNIPFVLIDREIAEVNSDLVIGDNLEATGRLMNYLIENGHRKIALVSGPVTISNVREREKGYRKSLEQTNLPINENWIFRTDLKKLNTSIFINKLLTIPKLERPTAIVAYNNFIAIDILNNLEKCQINCPEDISVACFDDPQPNLSYKPFLTVISQPGYEFGVKGMELLIEKIEGTALKEPRKFEMPSELIIRHSTKSLAVNP